MSRTSLTAVFRAYAAAGSEPADLDATLRARVDAARAAWPGLALDEESFVRHLAERCSGGALPAPEDAADLYLACACALGVPGAIEAFQRSFGAVITRAAARISSDRSFVDDATQVVHERLFVAPPGGAPKIADYSGRAPLRAWLSAAVVRTALNLRRRKSDRAERAIEREVPAVASEIHPELDFIKQKYAHEFESAVREVLGTLGERDRTLLAQHLGERLSVDRLAEIYGVGRSTTARWVAAARRALVEGVKAVLTERLHLSASEYASLAALVRSEIDVSVVACLRAAAAGAR